MDSEKYKGVWPVVVTPYDGQLKPDLGRYRALVEWYLEQGVHGVFALCLASEMYLLSPEERLALVEAAVDQVGGRVPVVATGSLGDDATAHVEFSRRLAGAGVDAVILTLPAFCETEDDLRQYFLRTADTLEIDLGIYECPRPRRRHLSPELVGTLARTGRFGPFKETSCEIERVVAKIRAVEQTPLRVLQANTALFVDACRAGARGMMGIIVNVVPALSATVWNRLMAGENVAALHHLMCLAEAIMLVRHPISTKVLLRLQGLDIPATSRMENPPVITEGVEKLLVRAWRAFSDALAAAEADPVAVPCAADEGAFDV